MNTNHTGTSTSDTASPIEHALALLLGPEDRERLEALAMIYELDLSETLARAVRERLADESQAVSLRVEPAVPAALPELRFTHRALAGLAKAHGLDLHGNLAALDLQNREQALRVLWAGMLWREPRLTLAEAEERIGDLTPGEVMTHLAASLKKCFAIDFAGGGSSA